MHSHNRLPSCKAALQPNSNFRALARETCGLICSILPFSNITPIHSLSFLLLYICPWSVYSSNDSDFNRRHLSLHAMSFIFKDFHFTLLSILRLFWYFRRLGLIASPSFEKHFLSLFPPSCKFQASLMIWADKALLLARKEIVFVGKMWLQCYLYQPAEKAPTRSNDRRATHRHLLLQCWLTPYLGIQKVKIARIATGFGTS